MIAVAAIAVAVLVAIAAGSSSAGGSGAPGAAMHKRGLQDLRALAQTAGLSSEWRDFFLLVAYGESGGNNQVGLGDPAIYPPWTKTHQSWIADGKPRPSKLQAAEAKAARVAYDRAIEQGWLPKCWPPVGYKLGSGGWFGILPANGLAAFKGTEMVCLHPWSIFDGPTSLVMAIAMARRLRQWDSFTGSALSLRVGWGAPSKMNDAAWLASKRAKFQKHADALGLPAGFLDRQLPPLPAQDYVALLAELGATIWLPESPNA